MHASLLLNAEQGVMTWHACWKNKTLRLSKDAFSIA